MTLPTFPCSELPRVLGRFDAGDVPLVSPKGSLRRVVEGGENDLSDAAELGAVRADCLQVVKEVSEFPRERWNLLRFSPSRTMFSNLRMSAADRMYLGL